MELQNFFVILILFILRWFWFSRLSLSWHSRFINREKASRPQKRSRYILKFFLVCAVIFISYSYYHILGPMPWKDKASRNFNREIKEFLLAKREVDLSLILKHTEAFLLVLPPYTAVKNGKKWNCDVYSDEFINNLNIQMALHNYLFSFIVFDSSGIKTQLIMPADDFFCDGPQQYFCMRLDDAKLSLVVEKERDCFRIDSKRVL